MTLQPFDRHPADPGGLSQSSTSLATEASNALGLASTTKRAYTPVSQNWQGIGNTEARNAVLVVSSEAGQVSGALAAAVVATSAWAESVRHFNIEVDRITRQVGTAGTGSEAEGRTVEEINTLKAAARRRGETAWYAAHETHIVGGRTRAIQYLKKGPSDQEILRMFQAGQLPMSVVNLYPTIDFSRTDWRLLFENLRARGIDPLDWATIGTYDPQQLKVRLDLLRAMGVPPPRYKNLLQMYWVSVAARKAGIDLNKWDPNRGARAMSEIIKSVYTYYGKLFLDNPYMQWAGMANMIGPSFAAGFFDIDLFRRLARGLGNVPGAPDMRFLANATDQELRFFEVTFLRMQKEIFFDQAMMHEAYLAGGMDAIRELEAAGLIDPRSTGAWNDIDTGRRTGNQNLVAAGNVELLRREQHDIIQHSYQTMYDRPLTGPAMTYLMTAVGEPSIPGARTYAEYDPLWVVTESPGPSRIPFTDWDNPLQGEIKVKTPLPGGNIALFDDRWTYVTNDTVPAYQRFLTEDPEQARALVASDVGERIDDYRLYHRIDSLLEHFTRDWGVDFDQ